MPRNADERIVELEIQLAHSQRLIDQINEVVTAQGNQIDRLIRAQAKLKESFENLKHVEDEKRDPMDEKPPHY